MLTTILKTVLIALTFAISIKSQVVAPDFTTQRSFACVVIDAQTSEPLSNATLRAGKFGWSADKEGRIEALVNIGDTLVFTHVGYLPAILEVKETHFAQNIVAVKLSPDTVLLSEVLVKPRRLTLAQEAQLAAMKKEISNSAAKEVFRNSTYQALSRPYAMTASDNQRMVMDNNISRMVNGGSISLGSISLSVSQFVRFLSHRNKIRKSNRDSYIIKPISEEELISLIVSDKGNQIRKTASNKEALTAQRDSIHIVEKQTPDSIQPSGAILTGRFAATATDVF